MIGLGQCIVEMVTPEAFNKNGGNARNNSYGVVTSGSIRRFLKFINNEVHIDLDDYEIKELGRIMGILSGVVERSA